MARKITNLEHLFDQLREIKLEEEDILRQIEEIVLDEDDNYDNYDGEEDIIWNMEWKRCLKNLRKKAWRKSQWKKCMANKPKLGSGKRFKQLSAKLKKRGVKNPKALAAYIGRKKYGKKKFQKLAAKGKKKWLKK